MIHQQNSKTIARRPSRGRVSAARGGTGLGVTLASSVLAADDLASGGLLKPFDVGFPVEFGYFLVCPEATADAPKISAFREWLLEEAGAKSPNV